MYEVSAYFLVFKKSVLFFEKGCFNIQTSTRGRASVEIIKFFNSVKPNPFPGICAMAWSSIWAVA